MTNFPNRQGGKTLMDKLYAIAISIGVESNNPDGGLNHDSSDDVIIETIVDIARGNPHRLPISEDDLTDHQREMIVHTFYKGAYDR